MTSNGSYKIKPRSATADSGLVMEDDNSSNENGRKVQQRFYNDNYSFGDEWYIVTHTDNPFKLLAINENGVERNAYFNNVSGIIRANMSMDIQMDFYTEYTKAEMLELLYGNEIFIIHTHGEKDGFMISTDGTYLTMDDIEQANLSNLKFALLLTCSTAQDFSASNITNNTPENIVEQMVCQGAETVIGFNQITIVGDCNRFAADIIQRMVVDEMTVREAIDDIEYTNEGGYFTVNNNCPFRDSIVIAGNENLNLNN